MPDPKGIIWRSEKSCGLNCLYVMLGVYQLPVDYARLTSEVITSEPGTSLTTLKTVARRYGLSAELGKTDPEGLTRLPKPFIAHLDLAIQQGEIPGHFVLVLKTTSDEVEFMDGTSGAIRGTSWREFQRHWSGHVMYVSHRERFFSTGSVVLLIVAGVFAGVVVVDWACTAFATSSAAITHTA